MRGAALMQAVARVDRTWPGKPSGLVVDFQGVIRKIEEALAEHSERDQEKPMLGADLRQAVQLVSENHQRIDELLHGCPWREIRDAGGPSAHRQTLTEALESADRWGVRCGPVPCRTVWAELDFDPCR
ncbi:hypothetical protein [Streptomyces zaehneri]|uniref:hypothetical protein n=1 Tax=Streptomyces zaehneri TaxID=3051180 RepID=UPI0028D0E6D5|nr:hypothetical protein [Streptomyces sp. DSM 40713]